MALLWMHSFDQTTTFASLPGTWTQVSGAAPTVQTTNKRTGPNALQMNNANPSTSNLRRTIGASLSTFYWGFAFRWNGAAIANSDTFDVVDGSTVQVNVNIALDNTFSIYRGNGTSNLLAGPSGYALALGQWHFIEIGGTIDNTAGTITVRVDGSQILTVSGVDTQATGNAFATAVGWVLGPQVSAYQIDDLYLCDSTGSRNNTFLGDVKVALLKPNGAGSSTQWTIGGSSPAPTNWESVDEVTNDDDTTQVNSSTVGQKDLYAMENLGSTAGSVKAVAVTYRVKKDDAGTRTVKSKVKHSGSEANGANFNPSTSYAYQQDVFETNPSTTSPWTPTEVNAMEAGIEVVA